MPAPLIIRCGHFVRRLFLGRNQESTEPEYGPRLTCYKQAQDLTGSFEILRDLKQEKER
jgi:hypothetical protein